MKKSASSARSNCKICAHLLQKGTHCNQSYQRQKGGRGSGHSPLHPQKRLPVVEKLLNSAIANAEHNLGLSRDTLYVAEIFANQGPSLKRFMPRAKGSASPILKRTSHITVILDEIK